MSKASRAREAASTQAAKLSKIASIPIPAKAHGTADSGNTKKTDTGWLGIYVGIGVAVITFCLPSLGIEINFYWAAALIAACGFLVAWSLAAHALLSQPLWRRRLIITAWFCLVAAIEAYGAVGKFRKDHLASTTSHRVSDIVFSSQVDELSKLQDFVGGKDEMALREVFDIPEMIHVNLLAAKKEIAPQGTLSNEQEEEIKNFSAGGQFLPDGLRYYRTQGDKYHLIQIPGTVRVPRFSGH